MATADPTTLFHDIRVICVLYDGSVTSWGRTEKRNGRVGGVPQSWHLWSRGALAYDLAFDSDEQKREAFIALERLGYEVLMYDSHLHVEPRG